MKPEEKHPQLDLNYERRHMTDREILEKYVNLEQSCLTSKAMKKVINMLYEYSKAFSFRDDIGTCPNIEVEIDVTDKSPFFIRPYQVRKESKTLIDKEIKCLCYLGILKEGYVNQQKDDPR